jgi:hypothetical protein
LHNAELHISSFFTNIVGVINIKGNGTGRICGMYGLWWGIVKTKKVNLKILTYMGDSKIDLTDAGWKAMDWIH